MAIAKNDRFVEKGIDFVVGEDKNNFPPKQIVFRGKKLFYLGVSNKDDLIEPCEDYDRADYKGQFIYCSDIGDMYDCCIYIDVVEQSILKSIRTRLIKK